ncbi:UNVERIFIED_CONTAM: protein DETOXIFICATION 46, chloroplastic [Sesamum calycinum]|uniref:Protein DETOXIFICATION n=1 Tax=Sesamum calycinum TaxID=2727403 RepID=A0AAW2PNL8_9LAMI
MILKTPIRHSYHPSFQTPNREFRRGSCLYRPTLWTLKLKSNPIFVSNCISSSDEVTGSIAQISAIEKEKEENTAVVGKTRLFEETSEQNREEFSENESLWSQMVEIAKFSGPAVGLWICGPLMSLIDTAVIGQGSSIELAALGPGTVFCDNTSYVFMFLSIATSNLVATSLARQDKNEVQHQISILLFIGLACGFLMLFFTRCYGPLGVDCLGMKDSWGPLKALAVASAINGIGDIVLCRFLGYGIAGAAWATMVSQVVAAYMMIEALNSKGYNGFAISVPSPNELLQIFLLAAPVFVTMMSKVAFYSLLVYFATSMGTKTIAAHQVMIQVYCMCTVWGEPLSQTAQSFMPELIYGTNRNLSKARTMLKSLVIIGALSGLILGFIGTSVPWLFPKIFSPDPEVIQEMHKVLIPYFLALCITPSTHSLEGTLLAGRDLKFISTSMSGIFCVGSLLLVLLSSNGYGLVGCWFTLVAFQWSRFSIALRRLTLPNGILYSEDLTHYQLGKLKSV